MFKKPGSGTGWFGSLDGFGSVWQLIDFLFDLFLFLVEGKNASADLYSSTYLPILAFEFDKYRMAADFSCSIKEIHLQTPESVF